MLDALSTGCGSNLPPSVAASRRLPLCTTRLSLLPRPSSKLGNKRGTAIDGYEGDRLVVLIGTQAIHQSTVKYMQNIKGADVEIISTSLLNELRGGELDGMTYSDIQNKYPDIWNERMKDKLHFRYPGAGGESYIDVIQRVKPIIIEVSRD